MSAETALNQSAPEPQPGQLRFLQVEDNPIDVELIQRELRRADFDFTAAVVQTERDFTREIHEHLPHIVLADYNLPQWRGMEALEILAREKLDVPLILVTGALGEMTAVDCIKQGATDYVLKGALTRLPIAIRRALQDKRLRDQRKRAEEALAAKAEELARSNHDLEQFAYVASHDLQEPLRMVASYTQLLGERYKGKLDDQADKYIAYAVEGAVRMQTLIQDLLAFSRAGRSEMDVNRIDCNQVVKIAMANLQAAITESGARVEVGELPTIMANASQLQQVFQNLIGNGSKFRGASPPEIHVAAERKDNHWVFSVADNGIGIAAEHPGAVFTIFKRLHTRIEYPGNGIGLSIAKKIIERHGGQIWVTSRIAHGSTFVFTLPAEPAANPNPENNPQNADQLAAQSAPTP